MEHKTANAPSSLHDAIATYSAFWAKLNLNSTVFKGSEVTFDGSPQDFDALAYCVYEVGFPEHDYLYASLIWAQAIVKNTEARWLQPVAGQYAIGGPEGTGSKTTFFPHTRLLEIVNGTYTQFDTFATLTDSFLLHTVLAGFCRSEIPKLHDLSYSQVYSSFNPPHSTFDCLSAAARLLRKQSRAANE